MSIEEIRGPNSSHKTGLIREGCPFFINMPKVLFTGNVELFLNTYCSHGRVNSHIPAHFISPKAQRKEVSMLEVAPRKSHVHSFLELVEIAAKRPQLLERKRKKKLAYPCTRTS
jgi:hypothetical protein